MGTGPILFGILCSILVGILAYLKLFKGDDR